MGCLFNVALSVLVVVTPFVTLAAEPGAESPSDIRADIPEEQAELNVKTEPRGAIVAVDSKYVGVSPTYGLVLPAGEYSVGVYLDGYVASESTVVLKSGEETGIEFVLSRGTRSGWFNLANFFEGMAFIGCAIALTIYIGLSTADFG